MIKDPNDILREHGADELRRRADTAQEIPFDEVPPSGKKQGNGHDHQSTTEVITRRASEIKPEAFSWLWRHWLARGKFHLIAGVPEVGKSTIAFSYAAIETAGMYWPGEDKTRGARGTGGNVLIWSSEDNPADTIIPRLTRMGADLDKIYIIEQTRPKGSKSRPFNPSTDMAALAEKAAIIGNVTMIIIDPVVAVLSMKRDSHKSAETRIGLQPVVDLGESTLAVVIGIAHLTKGTSGQDPLERVNGSGAFGQLPRLVMFAAKNSAVGDDEPERIMVRVKSNIGRSGGGFGYHIDAAPLMEQPDIEATRICWEYPLEGSARDLLNDAEAPDENKKVPKLEEAKEFLRNALAKGERPQRELVAAAEAEGLNWRTVKRASEGGEIGKRKDGLGGWFWWLT